jgi:subtilisin family serine protease
MKKQIEPLEPRQLMSMSMASRVIPWEGGDVEVFSGRWIVQLNDIKGSRDEQTRKVQGVAEGVHDLMRVEQQLAADGMFLVSTPLSWSVSRALRDLRKLGDVTSIEPDRVYYTQALPDDTNFGSLWGLDNSQDTDINAPQAWDITTGSNSTVIGVIDSGVQWQHPDLIDNIYVNPNEIEGNGIDDDNNGFVDDVRGWDFLSNDNDPTDLMGHGTHVAGTIGARGNNTLGVTGVNWNVAIMPFRCGGTSASDRSLSGAALLASANYVTMMRQRGVNIRATNNSWGGGGASSQFNAAIAAHNELGTLFIAAAGNDSSNNDQVGNYPSNYNQPNIIAVASITSSGVLSGFSNFGVTNVDIAAPGSNILSTVPVNGYAMFSGTSMASPHVAGVVGLLASARPSASATDLRDAILSSASPDANLTGLVATGRLNAAGALATLLNRPASPQRPTLIAGSDSGESSTDNITNDNTPSVSGVATPDLTITLYNRNTLIGTTTSNSNGDWSYTLPTLADGLHTIYATATAPTGTSAGSQALLITVDTVAPTLISSSYTHLSAPHRVVYRFDEYVAGSISTADISVRNLTTGQNLAAGDFVLQHDLSTHTTSLVYSAGILPDANFRASIRGQDVADRAGNLLLTDNSVDFFFLNGDTNRSRRVDFADLLVFTQYYGQTGRAWSQGNFNYDPQGLVDFADLLILSQRYNLSIPAPTASLRATTSNRSSLFGQSSIL